VTEPDLTAKVAAAWHDFETALAGAVPASPDTRLDLTLDPTASGTGTAVYQVSLVGGVDGELAAFAVGNAELPEGYRLERGAVGQLVALGWSPPGVVEGSGERFGFRASVPAEAEEVAALATATLRDVYGAPHPAFLTYDIAGVEAALRLGAARPAGDEPPPVVTGTLPERVRAVVAGILKTAPDALETDSDGDIGIRAGSAMVFVRVTEEPALVDVFSPLLTELRPSERLYATLAKIQRQLPLGRIYCLDNTVWASLPVFGRDFQPSHLELAVRVMTGLADELDDKLHGEFGGKRFFVDRSESESAAAERTGMYL